MEVGGNQETWRLPQSPGGRPRGPRGQVTAVRVERRETEKAVASRERGHSLRCGALERSQRFWGCWEMVVPVTEGLRQEGEPA